MINLAAAVLIAALPVRAQGAEPAGGADQRSYGVLLLAFDVDVHWRHELANLSRRLKGRAVESVAGAGDAIRIQKALDRLVSQRVGKVVAVPLDTVSESARMDLLRYFFGVRQDLVMDVPGSPLPLGPGAASAFKRLRSPVPLVLAPAMDKSDVLSAILADRAKALAAKPAEESLVLAGIAPRSDASLRNWRTAAQAVAEQTGRKAGFRKAVAVAVRDGVRSGQQDKDRAELRATFRGLAREGRVVVVPLSPGAARVDELLRKNLGGFYSYKWDGRGVQGDRRLLEWIKADAEAASTLPDGRQYEDGAPRARGGRR